MCLPVVVNSCSSAIESQNVCNHQFDDRQGYGVSRNVGGFFTRLGDIATDPYAHNAYHVFYSDLRSQTFAYSIKDSGGAETEYWVTHEGKATLLGREMAGSQTVSSFIGARFGYEGDYRNLGYESEYRDYSTGLIFDTEKVNPILGRYEVDQIPLIEIANPPTEFGFDVAVDGSLLASGRLPSGSTYNLHSVLGDLNNYFPTGTLNGQTLLPMTVR